MGMKKILIVEDEILLCKVLKRALEDEGYAVFEVHMGHDAVENIKKEKPDLIILDIKLPDMDGRELLGEVKKICPKVPVMMCSAHDSSRVNFDEWETKVSGYITKPVKLDELKSKVKEIVG